MLVGLGLAGFAGLVLTTGMGLFSTQARTPEKPPTPVAPVEPLRIADLNDAFVRVSPGTAFIVPADATDAMDPEGRLRAAWTGSEAGSWGEAVSRALLEPRAGPTKAATVTTGGFFLMRYEVTRGQWAEFLAEAAQALPQLERTAWIRELWSPESPAAFARSARYVGAWLDAAESYTDAEDMAQLRAMLRHPLSQQARLLLLAPPSWIVHSVDGAFTTRMPAGTANFPVSNISAIDVDIFVVWAQRAVRLVQLRLPNAAEFRRAFHGGNPPALNGLPGSWPWGDAWRPLRFNNRRYQQHTGQSGPIDVFGPTGSRDTFRQTKVVFGLAGNVAEWIRPVTLRDVGGNFKAIDRDVGDRRTMQVAGGSYLDLPEACRSAVWPSYERERRLPHVGFRLALPESVLGGGR